MCSAIPSATTSPIPPSCWICLESSDDTTDTEADTTDATLSLDSRGLAYADGFFTTMGVIDGLILWPEHHLQRLISHAQALQLALDSQGLLTRLQWYAKQLGQGMLKVVVTRSPQSVRGYAYAPNETGSACEVWLKSSAMTVATAESLALPNEHSVPLQPSSSAVCLSAQLACLPPSLAGLKSLNRLDTVLASGELQRIKSQSVANQALNTPSSVNAQDSNTQEAVTQTAAQSNIGEGLLRDMSGHWVEGTMSNVFYQLLDTPSSNSKNFINGNQTSRNYLTTGQWYTPSMAQSGVAGVMRQVIIDALSRTEYPVVIRSLQDEDLPKISQIFFCNALRGIMPMNSLTLLSGEVVRL
ncbi:aminotransferase class IV [Psychrobacter sp.]|uniref:aminotransferase class IV n=1 Tax=Psychrobacter sp. TaxID=56811 RepID=UPI003F9C0040